MANIDHAQKTLEKACADGAQLVVLPECWNSPYAVTSFPVYAEKAPEIGDLGSDLDPAESPSSAMLCKLAKDKQVWLVGGSIPERDSAGKLFNTCLVVNPTGQVVGKHRKVHLFDIDVPGKITFKESDSLSAGSRVTVVDTPWGGLGVGICYDIRFPELAILMRQRGCNLVVYPGAFNMVTGPAHWELLQRARAVDNQLFVAACSPARDTTSGGYVSWGHSSIVNPWGVVMKSAGSDEEIVATELDFAEVQTMRDGIPCWKQKRADLYEVRSSL
jgi:omega-amidase